LEATLQKTHIMKGAASLVARAESKEAITPQAGFYCESNYIGGAERARGLLKRQRPSSFAPVLIQWMDPAALPACLMFTMQANIDNGKKLNYVISLPLWGIIPGITFKFAASFEFNHSWQQSTSKVFDLLNSVIHFEAAPEIKFDKI